MKSTFGIIGIATLALIGFSTQAFAKGARDIACDQCLATVNLSYHQDRQIDGFRAVAVQQSSRLVVQIDRAEAELRSLTLRRWPNRIAIARKESELHALRDRQQNVWITYRLQVQAVLGPMQRVAWTRCASLRGPAPFVARPAIVVARPAPVVVRPAPVVVRPAPVAARPAIVAARPAPIAARPAPAAARPAPAASHQARKSRPLQVAVVQAPNPRPQGRR